MTKTFKLYTRNTLLGGDQVWAMKDLQGRQIVATFHEEVNRYLSHNFKGKTGVQVRISTSKMRGSTIHLVYIEADSYWIGNCVYRIFRKRKSFLLCKKALCRVLEVADPPKRLWLRFSHAI